MEQDLKNVTDWLNSHLNKTIIIQKKEQEDIDLVHIKISQFDIVEAGNAIDDYLDNALVLKGNGNTLNTSGELVPLPQDTYEIAITDLKINHLGNEEMVINTARANYTVSLDKAVL